MRNLVELKNAYNSAMMKIRALGDKARERKDNNGVSLGLASLTAEETGEFDNLQKEIVSLKDQIKSAESAASREKFLADNQGDDTLNTQRRSDPSSSVASGGSKQTVWFNFKRPRANDFTFSSESVAASNDYLEAYNSFLKTGDVNAFRRKYENTFRIEDAERGGYFVMPIKYISGILKEVDDMVHIQSRATVLPMSDAESTGLRMRTGKLSAWDFATELQNINPYQDTTLKFGNRVLTPQHMAGTCFISRDLLKNYPDIEGYIRGEVARDLSETLENRYLTGTGAKEPLGILNTTADGCIPTSRDITSAGATTFTFNDFQKARYSLKTAYRDKAAWLISRQHLPALALLRSNDGGADTGQYLWSPSRTVGEPDMILGNALLESEFMPSAVTTGQYFAIFADFRHYYIAPGMTMESQVIREVWAHVNQIQLIFRYKIDAMPIILEAFTRLKFA